MADDVKTGATGPAGETVPVSDIEKLPAVAKHEEDAIEAWFKDHFVGTALGGTTDLYNAAYAAKEDLKKRLAR